MHGVFSTQMNKHSMKLCLRRQFGLELFTFNQRLCSVSRLLSAWSQWKKLNNIFKALLGIEPSLLCLSSPPPPPCTFSRFVPEGVKLNLMMCWGLRTSDQIVLMKHYQMFSSSGYNIRNLWIPVVSQCVYVTGENIQIIAIVFVAKFHFRIVNIKDLRFHVTYASSVINDNLIISFLKSCYWLFHNQCCIAP